MLQLNDKIYSTSRYEEVAITEIQKFKSYSYTSTKMIFLIPLFYGVLIIVRVLEIKNIFKKHK